MKHDAWSCDRLPTVKKKTDLDGTSKMTRRNKSMEKSERTVVILDLETMVIQLKL